MPAVPFGRCNIENSPPCECLNKFRPNNAQAWAVGEWSQGCNRSTPLDCQNGGAFLRLSRIKLPDTRASWFNQTLNLKECKLLCSTNCSCTAYARLNISKAGSGCLLWFGDLMDIRDTSPGQEIYIRIASSELGQSSIFKIFITHSVEGNLYYLDSKAESTYKIAN